MLPGAGEGGLWRNFPDATSYKVASVLRAPGIPLGSGGDLTAPIGQVALAVHGVVLTNSGVPRLAEKLLGLRCSTRGEPPLDLTVGLWPNEINNSQQRLTLQNVILSNHTV